MIKIEDVTIGADPELFIINEKNGKVVSSIGLIPGEKGNPYTKGLPTGFGLETDNILAEFNIPPCKTRIQFTNNIMYMQHYINQFVKKINPDYGISVVSSMYVDYDQLQSDEAKKFGCDIDYNAYTEEANEKPDGASSNLRVAGCHIHLGFNKKDEDPIKLIKYLDYYIGILGVTLDDDTERRKLYGKAGSFRFTPYGIEYRVLGANVMSDVYKLNIIWDNIFAAIEAYNNNGYLPEENNVREAINQHNINILP